MTKITKVFIRLVVSSFFLAGTVLTASASESSDRISKVTITIEAKVEADSGAGSLNVTSDGEDYSVDSFQFSGNSGSFKVGEIPKVKVILRAEDGYRFNSSFSKGKVTIKGQGTCTDVKRKESGGTLEITASLKPVAGEIGRIGNVYWADSPVGKAKWDAADNVSTYEVKLYYKNTVIKTVDRTTTTTFDFYSYMTKPGDYYFKVRTVPKNSTESEYMKAGDWVESEELYIDKDKAAPPKNNSSQSGNTGSASDGPGGGNTGGPSGKSVQPVSQTGWTLTDKGWKFTEANGLNPSNTWRVIDNKWYFFDMAGVMQTGWMRWNGQQYYLTVNGEMVTGWLENNREWYYLGADGILQTGWVAVDGAWYYLDRNGVMLTNWQLIDGKWYYLDRNSGVMAANTIVEGRYVGPDGSWMQ